MRIHSKYSKTVTFKKLNDRGFVQNECLLFKALIKNFYQDISGKISFKELKSIEQTFVEFTIEQFC